MRRAGVELRIVPLLLILILALVLNAALHAAAVGHNGQTFTRSYAATAAVAYGAPGAGGQFQGFTICNNDQDTVFDTAACVRYRHGGTAPWDYRSWEFQVTVDDVALGTEAWYLIAIDAAGNNNVNCVPSSADVCILAKGTTRATIPAGSQGEILRVLPLTYYATGLPCCPESAATRGAITITFPAP